MRKHAPLHDAKKGLPLGIHIVPPPGFTAGGPGGRPAQGAQSIVFTAIMRGAFVKSHDDIRAQGGLSRHRAFGRESVSTTVERTPEIDATVVDGAQTAQRKNLKTAAVRENVPVPTHDRVQTA